MKGMPAKRSGEPKVKRFTPDKGSVPMVAIISPTMPAISPLISDPEDSEAITLSPSTPNAK